MSDQFRNIANRIVNFVAGERPSADKFNKLVSYFRNNIQVLNNAIGDLEGSQDPFSGSDLSLKWGRKKDAENEVAGAQSRYLDIATLGRLIGPSANLNARELTDRTYYIEEEAVLANTTVYHPSYPILTSSTISITGLTATTLDQPGATEFKVSEDGLEVTFGSLVTENTVLSYTTSPGKYSGGSNYQGARFNVIPDPNQTNGVEVRVSETGYIVDLPEITNLQSSLIAVDSSTLDIKETTNISNGVRSKYSLPKVLVDEYGVSPNSNPNEVLSRPIPKYFLYLKCETTKESFKEASYYYVDQHTVYIENIDLGDCNLDEHVFRIVTIGTDITSSIDDLRVKFKKHVHNGSYGESRVSIENLSEIYNNQGSAAPYFKSLHSKNPISYYLHRDGYKEGDALNANNMMRGHLVIGSKENGVSIRNGSLDSLSYSLVLGYSSLSLIDSEVKYLPSSPRIRRGENESLDILASQGGDINVESLEKIKIAATKSIEDNVSAVSIQGGNSPVNADIRMIGVEASAGDNYHAIQAKAKRVALEGEMTSVIGDFFEVGNVDYHLLNDENANIKRRPEESLVPILGNSKRDVKNIISGSRINKDTSDNSKHDPTDTADPDSNPHYRKSYLNINATLFRRERELYQIGYANADIPALYYDSQKLVDSNGNNPIGGYVIKSSYADILIGGYEGITNNGSTSMFRFPETGLDNGYLNIILDLGYDERGYPIYKNHKAGKEFEINILYTKDITIDFEVFLGIRFFTVGPFIKTSTFVANGNSDANIGTIDIDHAHITKYANSDRIGQYKYYGSKVESTRQIKHRFTPVGRVDGGVINGFDSVVLAGASLKIKGTEVYYPIVIDNSGGLSDPANSQAGINTAYTCEVYLDGTQNSIQNSFGVED